MASTLYLVEVPTGTPIMTGDFRALMTAITISGIMITLLVSVVAIPTTTTVPASAVALPTTTILPVLVIAIPAVATTVPGAGVEAGGAVAATTIMIHLGS